MPDFLLLISQHAYRHLRVLLAFQGAHGHLVGYLLAHERLAVDLHNLVASNESRALGRTVRDDVLHVDGVLADGELDADAEERAFQVVVGLLHVLGADVDGVRVEL